MNLQATFYTTLRYAVKSATV